MLSDLIKNIPQGANGRTILLEGPTGVGKTFQARSLVVGVPELKLAPYKVLLLSTERKITSIGDLVPDPIQPITVELFDYPDPTEPAAYEVCLKAPHANVYQVLHALRNEDHSYDVLYFDSIMRWMLRLLWHIGAGNTNPDKRSDYAIFKRKALNMLDNLASVTDATVTKRPVTVVATCGIEAETDTLDGGKKHMAAIDGTKVAPLLGHYFDDVLMMRAQVGEGGMSKYVAYTQANLNFDAKVSGVAKLPPIIENMNLFRVIKKLRGELV